MDHETEQLPTTDPGNPYHVRIAERAHQIYEERGGDDGSDLDHWLEAEREVLQQAHAGQQPLNSFEAEDDILQQEPHIEEHAIELEGGVIV